MTKTEVESVNQRIAVLRGWTPPCGDETWHAQPLAYDTDPAAMLELLKEMWEAGVQVEIFSDHLPGWVCHVTNDKSMYEGTGALPAAVAAAYLSLKEATP